MALINLDTQVCLKQMDNSFDSKNGFRFGGSSPYPIEDFFQMLNDIWEAWGDSIGIITVRASENIQFGASIIRDYTGEYFTWIELVGIFLCDSEPPPDPEIYSCGIGEIYPSEECGGYLVEYVCEICGWSAIWVHSENVGEPFSLQYSASIQNVFSPKACPIKFDQKNDETTGGTPPPQIGHYARTNEEVLLSGNPMQIRMELKNKYPNFLEVYGNSIDWDTVTEIVVPSPFMFSLSNLVAIYDPAEQTNVPSAVNWEYWSEEDPYDPCNNAGDGLHFYSVVRNQSGIREITGFVSDQDPGDVCSGGVGQRVSFQLLGRTFYAVFCGSEDATYEIEFS